MRHLERLALTGARPILLCLAVAATVAACSPKGPATGASSSAAMSTAAPSTASAMGRWQIEDETSGIDGVKSVGGEVDSSNEVNNNIGRPARARLILGCKGQSYKVGVAWPAYMGSDRADVRWRLDGGAVVNDRWEPSADGEFLGLWDSAAAKLMITRLASAKQLVVEASPYESGPTEADFDLDGIAPVAAKVLNECGPPAPAAG
jgi:hypothetical protein